MWALNETPREADAVTETNNQRYSILLVDDSSFMRKRLRQALEPAGFALVDATNGLSALDELEKREFSCILTDLLMPDMDGFGLLSELQRRRISTPVVVISADIQNTTRTRCTELGARQFVQKPIQAEELRSVVAGIVGGRS
jgi:CheY-like chemotaxis protein